ncbi:MAG TPA: DUF350 domain-containing protein [Candidatus Saccharimonadales bacterium]
MIKAYTLNLPDVLIVMGVILFWTAALWRTLNLITSIEARKKLKKEGLEDSSSAAPFDPHKELGKNNVSYAVQRSSLAGAQVIALLATIDSFDGDNRLDSFIWMMVQGLWVFVALIVSRHVVDWIVLPKIKNHELLLQNNGAVAAVEAGSYLGLGFNVAASLTGDAPNLALSIASTIGFYVLGLALVLLFFWLHELFTPYNVRTLIEEGNVRAGIDAGSIILAMSIVVSVGVAGDFTTWGDGIKALGLTTIISVALLYPCWLLLNVFGPGQRDLSMRKQDCVAPAIVSGSFLVLAGFGVAAAVSTVL